MLFTPAEDYDRYIGRYSRQMAPDLVRVVGVGRSHRALDVGCGPGALTSALAEVLGPRRVSAVDPSEEYVRACRARVPGADVRLATAEALPFAEGEFDAVLALLVVNLLADPEAGVREMARVTRPDGVVAAAVWAPDGMPLLLGFWDAALAVAPEAVARLGETGRVGYRDKELGELWRRCGLGDVSVGALTATASYADFDDLWGPIEAGAGKPGQLCQSLGAEHRMALRTEVHRLLGSPQASFRLTGRAWCVRGVVPSFSGT